MRIPWTPRTVCLTALVILGVPSVAAGQTAPARQSARADDGRIVARSPCAVHAMPYERYASDAEVGRRQALAALDSAYTQLVRPTASDSAEHAGARAELVARQPLPRALYDSTHRSGAYVCERIVYLSDGLRIAGYLVRAAAAPPGGHPVLIVNRGGNREFSKFDDVTMTRWRRFLDAGYLIVASQLRGSDGGDGVEEYGGGDVRDILNLVPLIRSLPGADPANVFMYGASRGGFMAYHALAAGMRVNAAVVQAGPVDLEAHERFRPGFAAAVYTGVPDYDRDPAAFYRSRNVLRVADRITTPLLLLHGTDDWRVPAAASLQMAQRLQELGRPYGLVMYAGDDHFLSRNRADRDRQALDWFAAHRAGGGRGPTN